MDFETFTIAITGISVEGFEDIIVKAKVTYKEEEFEYEKPVKVPIFKSIGQTLIEVVAYEAFWKMRKHWKRINGGLDPDALQAKRDLDPTVEVIGDEGSEDSQHTLP